ncbi:phosphotyrosine protein phosphatase [Marinicauda salina]|uniref:Phosphotyrosine protein phosphatase n=2 Tax=Marinicauda salina TaxID=2135793 RepID=A0A2U2BV24_9PROT|nr:phosphotyrosine protein phosphatase [Marinicauda salina]
MAEAFWRARFGADAQALSCGVRPAGFPDGFMIRVMAEVGVDLGAFECRDLDDARAAPVELVVSLAEAAREPARAFAEACGAAFEDWPVADPTQETGPREARLAAYRDARDAVAARIAAYASAAPGES